MKHKPQILHTYSMDGAVAPPANDGTYTPPVNTSVKTDFNGSIFPGMKGYSQPTPKVEDYVVLYPKTEIEKLFELKTNTLPNQITSKENDVNAKQANLDRLQVVVNNARSNKVNCVSWFGPDWDCVHRYERERDNAQITVNQARAELTTLKNQLQQYTSSYDTLKTNFDVAKQKAIDNYNLAVATWSKNASDWYAQEADRIAKEKRDKAEQDQKIASQKAAEAAAIEAQAAKQKADLEKQKLDALVTAKSAGVSEESALKATGSFVAETADHTSLYVGGGLGLVILVIIAIAIFKS
ncbi:MAG: hypothetical protein RLZZ175_2287 [Bacteroidota bacterium]|jgi:hypothetical protein